MALDTAPSGLVYFGDSLSDRGLAFELSSQVLKVPVPPASAGYAGTFSNGEVQSGYTARLLDVDAEVYAIGGAQAVGSRTVAQYVESFGQPDILLPNPDEAALETDTYLGAQVDRFVEAAGGEADPGTAAVVFIGANDYNSLFDPTKPPPSQVTIGQLLVNVIANIQSATQEILDTGVEQVFLYNLPDATFFPPPPGVNPALIEAGNQVVQLHNAGLAGLAQGFRAAGADVQIVDINRITDEITDDPQSFGFRPESVDKPMLLGIASRPTWLEGPDAWVIPPNPDPDVSGVDPAQLLFFDFLHPTTAAHGVLGAFAAASMTSETYLRGDGPDVLRTGDVDDLVLAGGGGDAVASRGGDDVVLAGVGRDLVAAGGGDDIVSGGGGDDGLDGGSGDDVLAGSAGRDVVHGGRGDDLLVDGPGHDLLGGGRGDDGFLYVEAALRGGDNAADGGAFFGGRGHDTLYLAVSEPLRAELEAELADGGAGQCFAAIDVATHGIERYVFVDPSNPAAGIDITDKLAEADLWGIV